MNSLEYTIKKFDSRLGFILFEMDILFKDNCEYDT